MKSIKVATDRVHADVEFNVLKTSVLTQGTKATIKYRNLIGERYIALTQDVGSATPLKDGATIGLDHTQSALDLTVLFNGFKPLFAALSPKDVNELSSNIISVLQGEGGNINSLLSKTASLTSTLADRDEVIGRTIANLNTVLGTVDAHDAALKQLIDQLQRFISGLAADRDHDRCLADQHQLADGRDGRPAQGHPSRRSRRTSATCAALATNLNKPSNTATFEKFLSNSPGKINTITRTATYGSWFNFYMCDFSGTIVAAVAGPGCPGRQDPGRQARRPVRSEVLMSIPFRERNPVPIGAIGLLSIALVLFLAFNVQSIPLIGGGDHYRAAFSEAGGLIKGDDVRIAGVKVGKVNKVDLAGNRVLVDFKVTEPAAFGTQTGASRADEDPAGVEVPRARAAGGGQLKEGSEIPLERTVSSYDIVNAFTDLATTSEQIDTDELAKSLTTLATEFKDSPPDVKAALDGLSRLSTPSPSRDGELKRLLASANSVSRHHRRAQQGRRVDHQERRPAAGRAQRPPRRHPHPVHQHLGDGPADHRSGARQPRRAQARPSTS